MLDFFRNHQRLMMALLILIVVPGLGIVGVQGFSSFFDENAYVASVNGNKISRADYDNALRQQVDRARQVLGAQFDPKMFETPEMRTALVDSLVQQRMLADETRRLHLTASDEAVRRALLADPVISSLRKPDGTIDVERYKQLLAMQGMTPEQYDERIRYGLASEQIPGSIQASAFTSKALAQSLTELAEQRRDVQGLAFRTQDYTSKVQPTDAQISAYFELHKKYPADRRKETTVKVSLVLNRRGNVVSVDIREPSGDAAFDEAALSMIRRSDPVPLPPAGLTDDQFSFSLDVNFKKPK